MSVAEKQSLDINWTNSAGSALGAVSAAVLLSTLGVVGTLLGAALGSLVITVGGALYTHSMNVTKEKAGAAASRLAKPRQPERVDAPKSGQAPEPLETPLAQEPRGQVLRGLPWKRIIGLAAALFALTMAIILAFELTTGRAVSTYTGGTDNTGVGTSIPGVKGSGIEAPGTDDIVPEDSPIPDDIVPDDVIPDDIVPDDVVPDDVVPDDVVPGDDGG
ncbi:MAG: hypothetical protein WBG89_02820 [Ornithinimicrobium sp.]